MSGTSWLPGPTLVTGLAVVGGLLGIHLWAKHGTGSLVDARLGQLAVTPATTLSHWWRHLWAGFFHKSWGHLGYNLVVFAVAFPFAARQMGPVATMANAYWIGPFVVFAVHLLLVLPLAHAGLPYATRALTYPLVGFSVMAYSVAGAAFVLAPWKVAAGFAVGLIVYETLLAVLGSTGSFIAVYHLAGFAMGYWVRVLWLRFPAG